MSGLGVGTDIFLKDFQMDLEQDFDLAILIHEYTSI